MMYIYLFTSFIMSFMISFSESFNVLNALCVFGILFVKFKKQFSFLRSVRDMYVSCIMIDLRMFSL